ncbi:MAG: diguanylate cyclase, partial [Gallionellaceae bacterium]
MLQSKGIKELRIIRGKYVIAQFGPGLPEEQAIDEMDRLALKTGKRQYKRIEVRDGPPLLRVEVPFIALKNFRGTNCLNCHQTPEGGVNGVASVVIDLSQEEATLQEVKNWLWAGHIAIQIFLFILMSWLVRNIIIKNIAVPVKKLQTAMSEIQLKHDLTKRADVDETNPDIGAMARTFNSLIGNLEHATERLELFSKMFHSSGEAILITDANMKIVAVNPAFSEITGYSADEVLGNNPSLLSSSTHSDEFYQTMWASINEAGQWQGEIWNRRKSDEIYPVWLSIAVVKNLKNEVINYISLFSDITVRKAAEQKIEFLAHYDALTKLPNRALFADRLKIALLSAGRHNKKVALLFMDLDKFKSINDTMGHLSGDHLLQSVAERLRSCVRETDTICRQGGDEFMVLLPDAENVAKKIIAAMSAPHSIDGEDRIISFSIGISIVPINAKDSE